MSNNKHYIQILEFLSKRKYATRKEIQLHFSIKSGGTLTTILTDLENCGFIERFVPITMSDTSLLSRYMVSDEYLQFYYTYISPQKNSIENRKFTTDPMKGLPTSKFQINLGFCFERWCRKNSDLFARILGFDKIGYFSGAFFNRGSESRYPEFQINLMYIRADHKILISEIKYYQQEIDSKKIFSQVLQKKNVFCQVNPKYKNYSYEFILITTEGVKTNKKQQEYFDHVICFDDIFNVKYW